MTRIQRRLIFDSRLVGSHLQSANNRNLSHGMTELRIWRDHWQGAIVIGSNALHQEGPIPEQPFSRPNSPSVRIVPRVVRLDRMSLTAENLVAESTIEVAERQRRWLRRGCWVGCALALAAVVVVMSFPLFARWQLRRDRKSVV